VDEEQLARKRYRSGSPNTFFVTVKQTDLVQPGLSLLYVEGTYYPRLEYLGPAPVVDDRLESVEQELEELQDVLQDVMDRVDRLKSSVNYLLTKH
jgi:hypothetical protein